MAGDVPDLTVEIAFTSTPLDTTPTWVDVTQWVLDEPGVQIFEGKNDELENTSAGRCTFTLDNADARFSPFNGSSPYVGWLIPRRQVRVTATWSAVDYVMFTGFVAGFPQEYDEGGLNAVVPIVAYDALAVLNDVELPTFMEDYITRGVGSVVGWIREDNGRDVIDSETDTVFRLRSGTYAEGGDLAVGLAGSLSLDCDGLTSWEAAFGSFTLLTTYSYSFWMRTSAVGPSSTDFMLVLGHPATDSSIRSVLGLDSSGILRYEGDDYSPGVGSTARSTIALNDGQVHHVVVSHNDTTSLKIYIDGEDCTSATGFSLFASQGGFNRVAGMIGTANTRWNGDLQDIVLFGKALSQGEAQLIYQLGRGYYEETTAARLGRVLDAAEWPAAWRDISTATTGRCYGFWAEGAKALPALQQVASTEQGRLFVNGSGEVTLRGRYSYQLETTASTVQATFSDDGADPYVQQLGFDYDDLNVYNDVTVTGSFGVQGRAIDQTSIDAVGRQTFNVSTQLASTNLCTDMATGLVAWRKDVQPRSRPMTVHPQVTPTFWPDVLALHLGDRVRFEVTPPGLGSQSAEELQLEQFSWTMTQARWTFTAKGSAIPPNVFILDSSLLNGTDVLGF